MMDENNKNMHGMDCAWCHHMGKHVLLRWVLGLLILAIVFIVGFKLGEFKATFYDGYGYSMMGNYGHHWNPGKYMMGSYNNYYPNGNYYPTMMRPAPVQNTSTQSK